jgi:hypothetical protein
MQNAQHTTITADFIKSVCTEAKRANGGWLEMTNLPAIGIGYSVTPFEDKTVIRFDAPVTTPDGQTGTRFRVFPASNRKPEGQFNALR